MTEVQIEALDDPTTWGLDDPSTGEPVFGEGEVAALRLADALCRSGTGQLEPSLVAELRSHFGEVELAELILVCGQANLNNRAGNAAKQLLGSNPE